MAKKPRLRPLKKSVPRVDVEELVVAARGMHERAKDEKVPDGWTTASWIERLRYLAEKCEGMHPKLAAQHRSEADRLEANR